MIVTGLLRTRRMNFGSDPSTTGVRSPPNSRDDARRDAAFHKRRWSPCAFLTQLVDRELNSGWYLNSVSGLVSKVWYRIPFDQSELSISKIPPTDSPTVRPGRHP